MAYSYDMNRWGRIQGLRVRVKEILARMRGHPEHVLVLIPHVNYVLITYRLLLHK